MLGFDVVVSEETVNVEVELASDELGELVGSHALQVIFQQAADLF